MNKIGKRPLGRPLIMKLLAGGMSRSRQNAPANLSLDLVKGWL